MDIKIKVTSLTKEDISNLLSDGLYGNTEMDADYAKKPDDCTDKCFEDICADILVKGGEITITDYDADGEAYGKLRHRISKNGNGAIEYDVTYKDIIKGMNRKCVEDDVVALYKDEGDFYTGWNILQAITFGEVVYG